MRSNEPSEEEWAVIVHSISLVFPTKRGDDRLHGQLRLLRAGLIVTDRYPKNFAPSSFGSGRENYSFSLKPVDDSHGQLIRIS